MSKTNLVLLLGAGATRGALDRGSPLPPLDQDFFETAGQISGRGTKRLATRVIGDVFQLYGRVSGIGLEQYFRDIETRAIIGSFAKTKNKPKDWKRRQRDLEELIRRVLLHSTCDFEKSPASVLRSRVHEGVLSHLRPRDTVITFNYDTMVEETLASSALYWDPGDGYGVDAGGVTHEWANGWRARRKAEQQKKSEILVLKLHGSVNWTLYKTNKIRLKPRPYVVRPKNGAPVFDKCSILPPGWQKRVDKNPYRRIWREARLRIESCSSLAVVGYSLPDADLLAKALFAEVSRLRAARRNYLRYLYVADPSDQTRARMIDLFVPALGAKGRIYTYRDVKSMADAWRADGPLR